MVGYTCNPSTQVEARNQKCKVILGYMGSSDPVWDTRSLISKIKISISRQLFKMGKENLGFSPNIFFIPKMMFLLLDSAL